MRVFLTGASGFLGSHLLRRLISGGHEVAVLLRSRGKSWRIKDLDSRYTVIVGTLERISDIAAALKSFAPQALAHLAWDGVGNSDRNEPRQLDNIQSAVRLVQVAKDAGINQVLALGSQAEYGPYNGPIDESTPTQPTTMYGVAKLEACHATRQLCSDLNVRWTWLRVFSTYGPMDASWWMIPYLIERLAVHEQVSLTLGEQVWDYLYVADAVEAMARVIEAPTVHGLFNLGSGQVQTIRRVAEMIRDLIDPTLPLGFGEVPYRADQVMRLEPRIDRLKKAIDWKPRVSLEEGLLRTVNSFDPARFPLSAKAA
ncbi:MAG: NAD(P)-dependent oxidoreductase [Armatimonadetes bacterium]|nr:NAD(P)-dependent oxidoreductase [Armatimonadota bacterium]